MTEIYYFDSYAIIEILKGSAGYKRFMNAIFVTSKLNLFEVYYSLLREAGEGSADVFISRYKDCIVDYDENTIRDAAMFKLKNKKTSMADAIGYCISRKLGIRFLTGDKEFENIENVEFVK